MEGLRLMFNKLNADELSELQERLFSGWNSAIRMAMRTDGSMFWPGVRQVELDMQSLYREVSDVLGVVLLRQPVTIGAQL
jgi:hypothetical protein